MKRLLSIIVAVGITLFCVVRYYDRTIARTLPVVLNGAPCDFLPYYQAAQHIVHGESPFLADGYIYPPLLAFLLTPLARLDYVVARTVWFAMSQLFLVASAVLLWRSFGRDWVSACLIAFVWAFGGAAGEALAVGQVSPLLVLLVVVALCCQRSQRGAGVALGFALKLFPGLLGLAVVFRAERRAVRTMISTALVAVLLPWVTVAIFLRGPLGLTKGSAFAGTPATLSWSLPSVVLRLLDPEGQSYLSPRNWMLGTNLEHFRLPFPLAAAGLAIALLTLRSGTIRADPLCRHSASRRPSPVGYGCVSRPGPGSLSGSLDALPGAGISWGSIASDLHLAAAPMGAIHRCTGAGSFDLSATDSCTGCVFPGIS